MAKVPKVCLGVPIVKGDNDNATWIVSLETFQWYGFSVVCQHMGRDLSRPVKVWGPDLTVCVAYTLGLVADFNTGDLLDVVPDAQTEAGGPQSGN